MGLDMYMTAKRYLIAYGDSKEKNITISNVIESMFPELKNVRSFIDNDQYMDFRLLFNEPCANIGYWRKANAIHHWFVQNVQLGNDDCDEYYVGIDSLNQLRDILINIISLHKKSDPKLKTYIEQNLPPVDGFFFGSQKIDEYYFDEVERTLKIIDNAIHLSKEYRWEIYYRSSW